LLRYFYILILLVAFNTHATSWKEHKVDDPIKSGSECLVNNVRSFGGYVYDWPSKYDQIFFPYTSSLAIWFCNDSGFIAFIGDFDNITAAEKTKISEYLQENPPLNIKSLFSKLKLLEKIYSFRTLSAESSNTQKRVFAYLYEQINEFETANKFRSAALRDIYQLLNTDLATHKRLEYFYIAANYERQLGNIVNSKLALSRLLKEIESIKDDELKSFGNYLLNLSKETPFIEPGGKLAPLLEKDTTPKPEDEIYYLVKKFPEACHEELQKFFNNIKPMFTSHFNHTLIEKNIVELLNIRRVLIDTGSIPHSTLADYHRYEGIEPDLNEKGESWKSKSSSMCRSEVNEFYDIFLLESSRHIANVVSMIATELTGVKSNSDYKDTEITLEDIDQLLVKKSMFYLYCPAQDYDVTEYEVCPERSMPYKNIFIKLKADILKSPLKVNDRDGIQRLFAGFSSLDI